MDSLSFKIRELEIQISVFLKRLEEDKENSKKIEFEINQVKTARVTANCILTNENRIIEESSTRLKKIHNAYQKMSKSATQDHQYVISNLAKELSQKKYQLESQVNDLKLKQEKEKKELEKIKLQVIIQNNKKKAILLKLQKNLKNSEAATNQVAANLMQLKNQKVLF